MPGPGATRARTATAPGREWAAVVTGSWSSGPARKLEPARTTQRDARRSQGSRGLRAAWRSSRRGFSYRRARRARPDCGLGLPQSGSLKGPRLIRLGLLFPTAPTPGQSGRGPEAVRGAHLRVRELKSWQGLKIANTRGRLQWDPGRSHLTSGTSAVPGISKASNKTHEWREL